MNILGCGWINRRVEEHLVSLKLSYRNSSHYVMLILISLIGLLG